MDKLKPEQSFLDDKGASDLLGISIDSLRSLRFTGRGPAYHKLGKSVRYSVTDLRKYLKDSRRITADQK